MKKKIPYPPCSENPKTKRPFTRHKWNIKQGIVLIEPKTDTYWYQIYCSRCGLNGEPLRW